MFGDFSALLAWAEALESLASLGATFSAAPLALGVSRPSSSTGEGPDRGTDRYHSWLPVTPELGHLAVAQVYIVHDGPRLFLCANRAHQLFLFLSVEDGPELARWMVIPISSPRLWLLTSNIMDLHQAFSQPEEPGFRLDFVYAGSAWSICPWPVEELTEAVLPDPGIFLNAEPPAASDEPATAAAASACSSLDETSKRLAEIRSALEKNARVLAAHFEMVGAAIFKAFKRHPGDDAPAAISSLDEEKKA